MTWSWAAGCPPAADHFARRDAVEKPLDRQSRAVLHRTAVFQMPGADFHCGLRGFTRAAFEKMDLQTTGMEFASEMVIKATFKHLKITEVPVTLRQDGRSRPPHLKPWRDGWRHLRFMLLFSPRWLFFVPGIFLSLLGIILGGALSVQNLGSAESF